MATAIWIPQKFNTQIQSGHWHPKSLFWALKTDQGGSEETGWVERDASVGRLCNTSLNLTSQPFTLTSVYFLDQVFIKTQSSMAAIQPGFLPYQAENVSAIKVGLLAKDLCVLGQKSWQGHKWGLGIDAPELDQKHWDWWSNTVVMKGQTN